MSVDYHCPGTLPTTKANYLRMNAAIAHALPAPDESWTKDDVPELVAENRRKMESFGIIEVVEKRRFRPDDQHLYRTKEGVFQHIQEHIDQPNTLPCGHTGVSNIPGGAYGCRVPDCDAEYDRETVEGVLW